jgi:hypothetical protein
VKYDRRVPLSSHGDGSDGVMPLPKVLHYKPLVPVQNSGMGA